MRTNVRPVQGRSSPVRWPLVALRGAIALVLGLAIVFWPAPTLTTLLVFLGALAIAAGLLSWVAAWREARAKHRWWELGLQGVLGLGGGCAVLLRPEVMGLLLIYAIAAWAFLTGILEILGAIHSTDELQNEGLLALSGFLSLGLGVLLAWRPGAGVLALGWVLGAYAILYGVLHLSWAWRLQTWSQFGRPPLL